MQPRRILTLASVCAIALLVATSIASISSCGGPPDDPNVDGGKPDLTKEDGPKGNCGPSNCNGCCSQGVCLPGDALDACGVGGAQCDACTGTNTCVAGLCSSSCGPQSCPGCCFTETATGLIKCNSAGETDAANCGTGGAACTSCGTGTCTSGVCSDATCKASCPSGCCTSSGTCQNTLSNTQCGKNGDACIDCTSQSKTCSSGVCVVDPNAKWDLKLLSAWVPSLDGNGDEWDSGSSPGNLPDVFITYTPANGGSAADSPVIGDTLSPTWSPVHVLESNVTAAQLKSKPLVSVWDNDAWPNGNDFVDRCTLTFTDASFNSGVRYLTCSAHATGENLPGVGWEIAVRIDPH